MTNHMRGLPVLSAHERIRIFGEPVHTYHYEVWTIMTYNKNLLTDFR